MAVASAATPDPLVAESGQASVLASALKPSTALAVWRRELSSSMTRAADAACATPFGYAGAFDAFDEPAINRFGEDLRTEAGTPIDPIADDLVALASLFADICDASPVRVRLETVADSGCRRFHFDNVAMRLVVTYRGAGTQWVSPAFAAAARAQQTGYDGPINEIRTGDVALFRGRRSNIAGMTLHRSPPLAKNAPARLIGVVDCVDHRRGS
ncbi:MAG: DUF1826 domain-containing protein [Parvularculaceae bacterium]